MKRHWLFFLSLLTLLGVLCTLARGLKSPSLQRAQDPLVSSSALRWRQGLPSHWRACLLQR